MTKVEGYPLNFNFTEGRWQPVTIRGPAPIDGYVVGKEDTILIDENGYPTPPHGMILVLTENGLTSVHQQFLQEREE